MNKLEESRRSRNCIEVHPDSKGVRVNSPLEGTFDCSLDGVFDSGIRQREVHSLCGSQLAEDLLAGYNCALVAYGQTGSGKTYSMIGGGAQLVDKRGWERLR